MDFQFDATADGRRLKFLKSLLKNPPTPAKMGQLPG
jgi:hypothetical protein